MSTNGKGDTPRPLAIPQELYAQNFDRIFRKRQPRLINRMGVSGITADRKGVHVHEGNVCLKREKNDHR